MKREETRERNRRALLDAALRIVARDGHQARLDEIAGQAGLSTGAVYSLFGSKDGLLTALAADYLGPQYDEIERAVPAGLDLVAAVEAFARYYRRKCDDPDALRGLSLQASMLDTAARDPDLGSRLAASVRAHEERLVALFTGRPHNGNMVTPQQAQRLATALRALFAGLSQGVLAGLAPGADEQYFAEAARALVSGASLLDQHAAPLPSGRRLTRRPTRRPPA
ncbi:MAG: TetR family transcriptional regulator [Nocardiopsaceae bacterium]|nr:TetR family transcriptional regulator [Nocardiopsaceae bacterium]